MGLNGSPRPSLQLNDTGLYPQEALAKSGINMLSELAVVPGLAEEVEKVGGLPEYLGPDDVDLTLREQGKNAAQGGGTAPASRVRAMTDRPAIMKPEWVELTSKDGSEMKWLISRPTSPSSRRQRI